MSVAAQTWLHGVDDNNADLMILSLGHTERIGERQRKTIIRVVSEDVAERHLSDAAKPQGGVLKMSWERELEYIDRMKRFHKPTDTLEYIGVKEALRPALESRYPEYWMPADSPDPDFDFVPPPDDAA